jgi:hypothetical protein
MALKISDSMMTTAFHVTDGPVEMYGVDANHAVSRHPDEWSLTPWDPQTAAEARRRVHDRKVAEARDRGHAEPAPLVEVEMTEEDRVAFEEWKANRDAALERLAAVEREEAEKRERDTQIATDKAIVASAPPQPDPARRPLAGAAKANAERKAARDEADRKSAEDKAEGERLARNVGKAQRQDPRYSD